ncbi:MAG TPA: hypothetical protein VM095_20165 [Pyrinomonadaceae bacterium]|nr:hypothetical protein [Pyrinomonadaceae bacterium]
MEDQFEPDQEMTESAFSDQALTSSEVALRQSRRADITVEFSQVVVIKKPEGLIVLWCPVCEERVNMITAEAAAVLSNVDTRTIYRRIEAGTLHFTESQEGLVLICLNSLFC